MLKKLKHFLIPHEHNDHKPHALRTKTLLGLVVLILILEVLLYAQVFLHRDTDQLAAVLPSILINQTNSQRASLNLGNLKQSDLLTQAAQLKANDMAAKGYFSHNTPEGYLPWHWLQLVGYGYSHAGENLAVNFADSVDVTKAWMNSPLHKANIVNNKYTEIGIAVASGKYKGRQTVFVVQFFGKPIIASNVATTPTAPVVPQATPAPAPAKTVSIPKPTAAIPAIKVPVPKVLGGEDVQVAAVPLEPAIEVPTAVVETNDSNTTLEQITSAPKTVAAYVFGAILLFLISALALAVFIKIRVQHPKMIAATIAVVVLVAGLAYFNELVISGMVELPTDIVASVVSSF
jgi:hypothetical protein